MSDIEPIVKAAEAPRVIESTETAIQDVLINAVHAGGCIRGIHQACKAIETRNPKNRAKVVFLAESVAEDQYLAVVRALCKEHQIPCIEVADKAELGQWAGLCKLDEDGKPRKIVPAGVVCVTDFGTMGPGYDYLQKVIAAQASA